MIIPTVGRIVWFRPGVSQPWPQPIDQPLAAIVTHVWSERCVNIAVFDANGNLHPQTSVTLLQDGDVRPSTSFAEWMPYQKSMNAQNSTSAVPAAA